MCFLTDWNDGTRAHRVVVREAVPDSMAAPNYVDAFAVARPGDEREPEAVLRAGLEQPPGPARLVILLAWRMLGFELGPRTSPGHVLGWRVERSDAEGVLIAVDGRRASSRIMLRDIGGEIVMTTFIVFRSRVTRLSWTFLARVHRRMVRYLIDRSALT